MRLHCSQQRVPPRPSPLLPPAFSAAGVCATRAAQACPTSKSMPRWVSATFEAAVAVAAAKPASFDLCGSSGAVRTDNGARFTSHMNSTRHWCRERAGWPRAAALVAHDVATCSRPCPPKPPAAAAQPVPGQIRRQGQTAGGCAGAQLLRATAWHGAPCTTSPRRLSPALSMPPCLWLRGSPAT